MSTVCVQCGRRVEGEEMAFCPYCGAKLAADASGACGKDGTKEEGEGRRWVRKALAMTAYPDRKRILLQGLAACPGDREILWELLFIGEEEKKKRGFALDFSIIKSYILSIYLNPGDFSSEQRERMRARLFEDPQLRACLALFEDPEQKQREYIRRLCREYVEIFLEGNSRIMGKWFGFQLDRNREKKLAAPVGEMIRRIRADDHLTPEQRELLWKSMADAYAARTGGSTEYLDSLLPQGNAQSNPGD